MKYLDRLCGRRLRIGTIAVPVVVVAVCRLLGLTSAGFSRAGVVSAGGGPADVTDAYRVLAPVQSGNLLLFPVVRVNSKSAGSSPFLTLDEGLKNGAVEVTEAGKVRGLVRNRGEARNRGNGP